MNRSRYVTRPLDDIDRAIIAALTENGRMTIKKVAEQIGLSSPSVSERIKKMEDAGAIRGYTVVIDPTVFGLGVEAHVRVHAIPGKANKVEQMLFDAPEVVKAERVTGADCFVATVVVGDAQKLQTVVEPFQLFASTDTAIILSPVVARRLPKL